MTDPIYKVGIIGLGYVGRGVHRLLEELVVAVYDPYISVENAELANSMGYFGTFKDKNEFKDIDMVVICVPTNTTSDGWTEDFSLVDESVKWVTEINKEAVILVKSAVLPNDIQVIKDKYKARVVISPEYMGEGKYFVPFWKYPDPVYMKYHDFQIFGGDKKDTSFCVDVFVRKMGPHVHYYQSDLKTVALCKFMENSWGATKVTFCNEWYDIAQLYGIDYNELRELFTADSRVEKMHTSVFPKLRGYGGKCFPKDIKAIIKDAEKLGYRTNIMRCVDETNDKFKK